MKVIIGFLYLESAKAKLENSEGLRPSLLIAALSGLLADPKPRRGGISQHSAAL